MKCLISFIVIALLWSQPVRAQEVEISIEDNLSIADNTLRRLHTDAWTSVQANNGRLADVDDLAFLLETYYHEQGFPNAVVTWEVNGQAPKRVVFKIREGAQVLISSLDFQGSTIFKASELQALLTSPRSGFLGRGMPWFIQADIDGLPSSITRAYLARGYLSVSVEPPEVTIDERTSRAAVTVNIHENQPFHVGSIQCQGQQQISNQQLDAVIAQFRTKPAAPVRRVEIKAAIVEYYRNQGYAETTVRVTQNIRREDNVVDYQVQIEEGEQITIDEVRFQGNESTNESFLRERLRIDTGMVFAERAEREAFRRLFATGLFNSVSMSLEGQGSNRDLWVTVEERPSFEVFTAVGYGSYERARGSVGFEESNLFGNAKKLKLELGASTVGQSAEFSITDPWLFGSDIRFDIPFEYLEREEPSFTRRQVGFGAALRSQILPNLTGTISYQLRRSESLDIQTVSGDVEDDVRIGSVRLQLTHDTRNDPFNANRGLRAFVRTEFGDEGLGSELEFTRTELSVAQHFPLHERIVLAVRAQTGFIKPINNSKVIPIQERFFNGGENTVRSFAESELGPKDQNNEPIGGEAATTATAELRFRVAGALQTSLFYDYGNVATETDDYWDDFRSGVGGGVQYLLPVGSIRLDLGWNPSRRRGEDSYRVHLAIGMAF